MVRQSPGNWTRHVEEDIKDTFKVTPFLEYYVLLANEDGSPHLSDKLLSNR